MTDDKSAAPVLVFQRQEGRDIEDEKAALRAEAADYGLDDDTAERIIRAAYLADWTVSLALQILRARCDDPHPDTASVVQLAVSMRDTAEWQDK
jgi:hypothetical protein